MSNPKVAVETLAGVVPCVGDVVLGDLTFGKAVLLDQIKSPYFDQESEEKRDTLGLLKTLFVLAHPAKVTREALGKGRFEDAVVEWGDGIPLTDMGKLLEAWEGIVGRCMVLMPNGEGEEPKKGGAATAG